MVPLCEQSRRKMWIWLEKESNASPAASALSRAQEQDESFVVQLCTNLFPWNMRNTAAKGGEGIVSGLINTWNVLCGG